MRRKSKGRLQGIRKRGRSSGARRNNPNRQRLAKDVAKEEKHEEVLQSRCSRTRTIPSARMDSHEHVPTLEDRATQHAATRDALPKRKKRPRAKLMVPEVAFQKLVQELKEQSTKATEEPVDAGHPRDFGVEPAEPSLREPDPKLAVLPSKQLSDSDGADSRPIEFKDFSGDAATRERRHFKAEFDLSRGKQLEDSYYRCVQSTVAPRVGKVDIYVPQNSEQHKEMAEFLSSEPMLIDALGIQPSILERLRASMELKHAWSNTAACSRLPRLLTTLVRALRNYLDVLLYRPLMPVAERKVRNLIVIHCLSHVLRARGRVLRNDAQVRAMEANGDTADDNMRDQGFARPRVLYLVPMRNDAFELIQHMSELAVGVDAGEKGVTQVANKERFLEEFGPGSDDENEERREHETRCDGAASDAGKQKQRPDDWKHRFRGDCDDDFKIGIALTKKSVSLYSDFFNSDIIVASPLGLARSFEAKKARIHDKRVKERGAQKVLKDEWVMDSNADIARRATDAVDEDDSFLSSIEICVIDGANTFGMQNWSTLMSGLGRVNKMPERPRETDFSRVREWALDGLMRYFRQTILLGTFRNAQINAYARSLCNHAGRIRIVGIAPPEGSMKAVTLPVQQRFQRVNPVSSPEVAVEKRIDMFTTTILPELRSAADCQAIVMVPSYLDYVRVRNRMISLADEDDSFRFATLCEYSKASDIARTRTKLFQRRVDVVLMTERFHFYWRYRIRGANVIVWYGLPENPTFYPEIMSFVAEGIEQGRAVQSIALYDRYDFHALERIVGSARCKRMVSSESTGAYLFSAK